MSSKRKSLASPSLSLTVTKTTSRHFCARNASLLFFLLPPFCRLPIGSQVPICKSGEKRKSGFVDCLEKPLGEPSQLLRRRLTFLLQPHVLLLQLLNLETHSIKSRKSTRGFLGSTCASSSPRSLLSPASSSSRPATLSSRARTSSSRVL